MATEPKRDEGPWRVDDCGEIFCSDQKVAEWADRDGEPFHKNSRVMLERAFRAVNGEAKLRAALEDCVRECDHCEPVARAALAASDEKAEGKE